LRDTTLLKHPTLILRAGVPVGSFKKQLKMYNYKAFKKNNNIDELEWFDSTKSDRKVASFVDKDGDEVLIVTTAKFDPEKPAYVCTNLEAQQDGKKGLVLTNKCKTPAFTL